MRPGYPDLDRVVETVQTLQICRSTLALGQMRGADEKAMAEMHLAVRKAEQSVEWAADLLADSEERRRRERGEDY